ncbi:MAG: LUD domain-containing protein, partial [Euryarchaeota archaeon]|nr:LUD domain-containing protein [Euryarchaeota archaeon]
MSTDDKAAHIRHLLDTEGDSVQANTQIFNQGRYAAVEGLDDYEGLKDRAREIKEDAISRLPDLIDQLTETVEANGGEVYLASDEEDANRYITEVAESDNAETLVKSKSMTSEEIEVNDALESAGVDVYETDLGEFVIQLAEESPSHIVGPAIHKSRTEIAELFNEVFEPDERLETAEELTMFAREYLGERVKEADIGMTGANVGIAETGGIVIETNEGNARLVTSIGNCHICVMGVEKIVDTIEDALLMVLAHPVSATGQLPTTYVTWMHGRSPLGEGAEKPRESHIIILDNGRSEMRQDPDMAEALHCIRCGACMNICPTYGVVGGHTFGHIYPGPIGIPWTAQVHGLEKAGDFAPLCISCGLCQVICPADINMPMMIARVKDRDARQRGRPVVDRVMMAADELAALGSATAPFSNWLLKSSWFRILLEKVAGLDRRRTLPEFSPTHVFKRFRNQIAQEPAFPENKVAFFSDVYARYNAPELAIRAVEHLQGCKCKVVFPKQKSSGYPFIAYGDLAKAEDRARYNVANLIPFVRQGYDIVSPEPTAVYALRKSYPSLMDNYVDAVHVSKNSYELFEYLLKVEGKPDETLLKGRRFG